MNKIFTTLLCMILSISAIAQQKIQLRSADRAECVKSDMNSLKATFSFSTIEAQDYESERGTFSWLSLPNTVIGGNEGDPQIPVVNQLIAVPFGANPRIEITSYSSTDYNLADYDMKTLVPRQLPVRKSQKPEDVPFIMNEAAYQSTRGLRSEPQAVVGVEGIMRGVQLGKMTIEPVSYDPVNNTIRVFNDIEVTVHFDGADAQATEQMLVDTYSPYFDIVYKQLFNGRAIMDAYSDHQDLYTTPVKMLVVTTSTFTSSTAFQNWLTWKKQKGIDVDVQEVTSSTSAANVRSLIQSRYNTNHPTFLVIVGDETVVRNYTTYNESGNSYNPYISDNQYASIDSDVYHDMYMSRMSVANTTQLGYLVNKILMYEKYTMTDPSYLNNTLLVAGWDSYWTKYIGKPTIQYATNNYYNTAHGITATAYYTNQSGQTAAYNNINNVGFLNYTAHGDIQMLADPEFTNSNANSMTNSNKPMWIVANCCLTANWGNSSYSPCLGETMIRANNKGAFGYIGSVPESLWYEDYYFGVGAFNYPGESTTVQTVSGTTTGMYDALFDDTGFNTLNSVPYIGNVAVTYAHAKGYESSVSDEYYWRGYQCLGDGSVMPYLKVPTANTVSHANQLQIGATTFTVNADARSYVAITVNNEIIGVAAVPANATSVDVPITAQNTTGTAMIVVTRNQRQPYITTIPIVGGTEYNITVNANPSAGGTVEGAGKYYGDSECTLTATPNHGYVFANWTLNNNVVSTNPTYTFTVKGDASYTANFTALTEHHFSYTPQQEHGTISVSPATAYVGDIVTLTATPEPNYHLDHWDVNTVSKGNVPVVNNQFEMPDSDVTISASFRSGFSVTVLNLIGGTITVSQNTAQPGDRIQLSVRNNEGYIFMSWNVYETGNSSNTVTVTNDTFTMPEFDVTVSAVFGTNEVVDNVINVGGTSGTSNNYFPTYSANRQIYSVTEQIYTSSEIGDAGTITGIEFYYSGTTARTRTLDIYMISTTKNNFSSTTDWIVPTSANLVYSGSVAFSASSWKEITFTTPFEYNGTSNVALMVYDHTGGTYVTGMNFHVYTGSNNQAMRVSGRNTYTPTSMSNTTASARAATKNIVNFHITQTVTQPLACEAPVSLVYNITPTTADFIWAGESDSYNIRYRETTAKFFYDFESAEPFSVDNFSPCTTYDGDGSATYSIQGTTFTNQGYTGAFIAFQDGVGNGLYSHGGTAFGACFAATTPPNNDWFILPAITIEQGDIFSFWAMEYTDDYPEAFKVGVYRGDGSFSSYLAGSANTSITPTEDWTEYSYDLSSYAGQTIQLAIQCVSNDAFIFGIDDIFVGNSNGAWTETITDATAPYTLENLTPETIYDIQVQGFCEGIGETEWVNATFSTPSLCSTPSNLISEPSAISANVEWTGFLDSYNVRYRVAGSAGAGFFDDFESGSLNNWDWTTYTQGDAFSGFGWFDYNPQSLTTNFPTAYSGSQCAISLSYGNSALNANNYLVTPQVELGGTLKFWIMSNYADEYEVLLSTTGNAVNNFTTTLKAMSAAPASWTEVTIDLSNYEGRQGYIAIHHVFYDGWGLFLDDFGIYGDEVPAGEWHTLENVANPYTITNLDPETNYEWQVQGICTDGTTDWSDIDNFTTLSACDAPVGLSATDVTSNTATLNWSEGLEEYNVRYTAVSFFESFENGSDGWITLRNGQGTENTDWHVINSETAFSNEAIPAHSGTYVMMTRSYSGSAYSVDNWLISPQVTLDGFLKFWVMDDGTYHEHFDVYVSTTGTNVRDFSLLYEPGDANAEWTEVIVDLRNYNGAKGYIAIRNIDEDQDFLFLDDFGIYPNDWEEVTANTNTIDLDGLVPGNDYIWQVQGVDCDGNGGVTEWSNFGFFTTIEAYTKHIDAYSGNGGYYLIASPIGQVSPEEVTNMTENDFDLYYFDQAENLEWVNYKEGDNNVNPGFDLETGKGYLYANSESIDLIFTGSANTDVNEVTLTLQDNVDFEGWNLVGNPFAVDAYIDCDYYRMNENGTDIMTEASSGAIEAMEGVFVIAESDGETLTFTTEENAKNAMMSLNITQDNNVIDRAIVRFGKGKSLPKFQLFENSTKLYFTQDNGDFAVVCGEAMGEMPVNFKAETNSSYTLSISSTEVNFTYLHLIDNLTGADIDLLETPNYSFNAKVNDYASRFKLVYSTGSTIDGDNFCLISNNHLMIFGLDGQATLKVMDVTGRTLSTETFNGSYDKALNLSNGVYVLQLIQGNNVKNQKIVVK